MPLVMLGIRPEINVKGAMLRAGLLHKDFTIFFVDPSRQGFQAVGTDTLRDSDDLHGLEISLFS